MTNRYQPFGTPLTPREAEIIDQLIEEASEVIHAASKLKRFGVGDRHPERVEVTNLQTLGYELGDMAMMVELAGEAGLVLERDIMIGKARKAERLKTYSRYLP